MKVRYGFYKDGKKKALTMSYDDGHLHDLRLAALFAQYGIRGTFHLNSAKLGLEKYLTPEQVKEHLVANGMEISCHSLTHPFLDRVPGEEVVEEIMEDRRCLEALCGYPVRGMSYPFGTYTEALVAQLKNLGMHYSRTTKDTGKFSVPEDFMRWHPTCHHVDPKLMEYADRFLSPSSIAFGKMPLFYVWGHSFEFPRDNNWELIEAFCEKVAGKDDVWYATNIEIYDYISAMRAVQLSADRTLAFNPSATDVWLAVDGEPVKVAAGTVTKLN